MTEDPRQDEGAASITRAQALRPSVPLYRHMVYGSGLSNPLDFLIIMHVQFMCEDGKEFTVQDLVGALRAEGIRNANGKGDGLVGSKAVYEAVARLRGAGFLHRTQGNGGSFGKVSYTFHEFPAADPGWTPPPMPESPTDLPVPLTDEAVPVSNSVSAGQTASPHKASADKGSADRRSGKTRVPAGHTASPHRESGKPSPPHPPEGEVGTTSPSPLKPATPSRRNKQQRPDVAPEAAAAAREFLMKLPGPWAAGAQRAANLAPWLVQNAELTGWSLDLALRMYLTRRESGKRPVENYGAMLAYRVKEMQSREAVVQAAREAEEAKQQPQPVPPAADAKPGRIEWCGKCNNGEKPLEAFMRVIPSPDPADDSVTRCPECHPAEVARRTARS
ncbi:hypothetical protein [Streptomyces hebeiensis]